jgi:hypothetical protein
VSLGEALSKDERWGSSLCGKVVISISLKSGAARAVLQDIYPSKSTAQEQNSTKGKEKVVNQFFSFAAIRFLKYFNMMRVLLGHQFVPISLSHMTRITFASVRFQIFT